MSIIETRRARPDDAEECAAILQEWIDETDWFPSIHPAGAAASMLRAQINAVGFTLALENGQIAGFSCLANGVLEFLYIRHASRGKGIGCMLLDRCKFTNPGGFSLWTFQQNLAARRFYEREGFIEAERSDGAGNEEGLPDIRYIWEGRT
ncbi:MAG: GNAT family N-acetyltransferase [Rhodobacteraceae bacterium]|nr:GNAT family N-acetyltransferase [Paracoccaceae bacterium]